MHEINLSNLSVGGLHGILKEKEKNKYYGGGSGFSQWDKKLKSLKVKHVQVEKLVFIIMNKKKGKCWILSTQMLIEKSANILNTIKCGFENGFCSSIEKNIIFKYLFNRAGR